MLLFLVVATSILWIGSCILGLAFGAMLAGAEGRGSSTSGGRKPADADRLAVLERLPALERLPVGEHARPPA